MAFKQCASRIRCFNSMATSEGLRSTFSDSTLYDRLSHAQPTIWRNPKHCSDTYGLPLQESDRLDAHARWNRFAPLIARLFPSETTTGHITSPLDRLPLRFGLGQQAQAFLKADSHLPVCASVKARGGLYEVFCRAEQVVTDNGLLSCDEDYSKLATGPIRQLLGDQEVAVGSTGNLGMSVGLAAAGLGMKATVHMSTDAKEWKKNLLRSRGVSVVEHAGLYSEAVENGRKLASENPLCHFVDDEASTILFLGYSAAAAELASQLKEYKIELSADQPLVVYIPCGVGGAPGGICWGLKQIFGDLVHVFFAEPTHAPCVTVGLASGLHDKVCVEDLGLDGKTEADGLAVGRPSGLVCQMVDKLVAGIFTVDDSELFQHLAMLLDAGGRFIEPSCCASLLGPARLAADPETAYLLQRGTHVFWATGGALVPEKEQQAYYARGKAIGEQRSKM